MRDGATVTAGLVIAALGVVLLLDALGAVDVTFGAVVPLVLAAGGTIILASGLGRRL